MCRIRHVYTHTHSKFKLHVLHIHSLRLLLPTRSGSNVSSFSPPLSLFFLSPLSLSFSLCPSLWSISFSACTSTLNPVWTRITQQPTCLTWSYNTPFEVIGLWALGRLCRRNRGEVFHSVLDLTEMAAADCMRLARTEWDASKNRWKIFKAFDEFWFSDGNLQLFNLQ